MVFISNSTHLYLGGVLLTKAIMNILDEGLSDIVNFFVQDFILKLGAFAILTKEGYGLGRIALQL
jgi:hypothetical protein